MLWNSSKLKSPQISSQQRTSDVFLFFWSYVWNSYVCALRTAYIYSPRYRNKYRSLELSIHESIIISILSQINRSNRSNKSTYDKIILFIPSFVTLKIVRIWISSEKHIVPSQILFVSSTQMWKHVKIQSYAFNWFKIVKMKNIQRIVISLHLLAAVVIQFVKSNSVRLSNK